MAGNKSGEKTKEKILDAAQHVFVEKGFADTRMEDVAQQAGITKTMLYYHFDTKRNLLQEISLRTVSELKNLFEKSEVDKDSICPQIDDKMHFFEQRRSIIRLIVAEYIGNPDQTLAGFTDMFEMIRGLAGKKRDDKEFLVRLFFFNALPMLLYACVSEKFCDDYTVDKQMSHSVFAETFSRVFSENVKDSRTEGY